MQKSKIWESWNYTQGQAEVETLTGMRPKPYVFGNHNKYYDFTIYNLVVSQTEFAKLAANKVEAGKI